MNNPRKTEVRIEKGGDTQPWDTVYWAGPMDEDATLYLTPLFQTIGKTCVFNFRDVTYVNSNGIRCWVLFLRDFKADRTIEFSECAPVVVSQMNMLPSFRQKVGVRSVYVPFTCGNCKRVVNTLYLAKDFPAELSELAPGQCEKCGSETTTEDLENDFFGFMDL